MVKAFEKVNEIKIPYKIVNRRAGDIDQVFANPIKAEMFLGWKAEKTVLDMCKDTWNWQVNNPFGFKKELNNNSLTSEVVYNSQKTVN